MYLPSIEYVERTIEDDGWIVYPLEEFCHEWFVYNVVVYDK